MICLVEHSIDDLLHGSLQALIANGEEIHPSRGAAIEVRGARLELKDPRARLSRSYGRGKVFSCLGELVWYLAGSGSLDHIGFYLPKYSDEAESDGNVHGAYGTRLFSDAGRLRTAIDTLCAKQDSRQAVIPLLDATDLTGEYGHTPCTMTLQLMLRNGYIEMIVYMRSNDAYLGLPHDIFTFTMLQELVARTVSAELGTYVHMVGSLHLYNAHREATQQFLQEGHTYSRPMPEMPPGDPWEAVDSLVKAEAAIRIGDQVEPELIGQPYWDDLIRLLSAFALSKSPHCTDDRIAAIRRSMHSRTYDVFYNDKFDLLEA